VGANCASLPRVLRAWAEVLAATPPDQQPQLLPAADTAHARAFAAALAELSPETVEGMPDKVQHALQELAEAAAEPEQRALALGRFGEVMPKGLPGMQRLFAAAAAKRGAADLLAEVEALPASTRRDQEVVRIKALQHTRSIGTAFLQDWVGGPGRAHDGLLFQLTLRRVLGVERELPQCGLCGKEPGGTLHARFCGAPAIRGYNIYSHDRVKLTLRDLLRTYVRCPVITEARAPFVARAAAEEQGALNRIDLLVPEHAFTDCVFGALQLGIDVCLAELQCPSHLQAALEDPAAPCMAKQALKQTHYASSYDWHCFNLAVPALGSFGVMSRQGEQLVAAMAEEWAGRECSDYSPGEHALRSAAVGRIRARLSTALHLGLSQRVLAYMGTPGVAGGGTGGGEREFAHAAPVDDLPWQVPE
jgi:hypothetical protein